MNELEIMKEQLELMKEKLNSQAIINNRLLRSSIRERLSWTKRYTYVEIFLLLPFIYFMYAGMTYQIGLSWWLYAYTVFMCTACVGLDFWINNIYISRRDYQNKNLLMLGKKIALRHDSFLPLVLLARIRTPQSYTCKRMDWDFYRFDSRDSYRARNRACDTATHAADK